MALGGHFKVDSCDLLYGEELEADKAFVEAFPECVKWSEVADEARILQNFLDYLRDNDGFDEGASNNELIYAYFGINEKALEENRSRLYETLRKNPWPVVVVDKKDEG